MTDPTDEQFLRDHDFGFLAARAVRRFPCGEFWTDPGRCDRETILKLIALLEPGDDHFLANPIRIDVPDREQLLADVEFIEQKSEDNARGNMTMGGRVVFTRSALNLAAHTRRTLLGEK